MILAAIVCLVFQLKDHCGKYAKVAAATQPSIIVRTPTPIVHSIVKQKKDKIMATIENTSKAVLAKATKYSNFNRKKLDAMTDSQKDGLCAAVRSMSMSLITQAPDKEADGVIILDIENSAADRLAAKTFANATAYLDADRSMKIMQKIHKKERSLDGGTVKAKL